MRFGITARFPLGVFQGHRDGRGEPFPSTGRLHSALIAAASKGCLSEERAGDLRATSETLRALEWMERNPPNGVTVPPARPVAGATYLAYRAEGVMDAAGGTVRPRVTAKRISDGIAVGGVFAWVWDDVPDGIAATLTRLCEDVPVLGEADSPVVLEATVVEPTLVLDPKATDLNPRGLGLPSPTPGRVQVLEAAYERANPKRRPTLVHDAFSLSQRPSPPPVEGAAQTRLSYVAPDAEPADLPWTEAWLFPTRELIPVHERVAWCVTFHRAIAKLMPGELPGSITGKYPAGASRPANRVAVPKLWAGRPGGFAVLVPQGMTDSDKNSLAGALMRPVELFTAGERIRTWLHMRVAADEFWHPVAPGHVRRWRPVPGLVAEVRRQSTGVASGRWTMRDAACLAMGFVFRDQFEVANRDYAALVQGVRSRGADVDAAHLIADSRVSRFAHKLPRGLVAQPMSALFKLGTLAGDRTILAVGQSRHLGGGLLVPVDLPEPRAGGVE